MAIYVYSHPIRRPIQIGSFGDARNGRIWMRAFLWKDRVTIERSTIFDAAPCHIVDIRPNIQRLSTNLDALKRETETQNRLVQLGMEGKHSKSKLVAEQL